MKSAKHVNSIAEWLKLPEIFVPTLRNKDESGSVLAIVKVGFLAVSEAECYKMGVAAERGPGGKCVLPTAIITTDGTSQLYRLPVELARWAFDSVALAHAGRNVFPSNVEFGKLSGRVYAEHVL
jgi:hypothetical protein